MQYDNVSRYLHIQITNSGLTDGDENAPFDMTGCEARMFVKMPDSQPCYFDGDIADGYGGIVTFLIPNAVTQTVGEYPCIIRITNASEESVISTRPFMLRVEESIVDDEALAALPEYSTLENALFQVSLNNARMDNLVAAEGASDTELIDLRTGYDGTPYATAGGAVRAQIGDIYANRRAATTAEFMAAMGETYADNDEVQAVLSDLQTVLQEAESFETRLRLYDRMLQNLTQCLPDGSIARGKLAPALRPPLPLYLHVPYKIDVSTQGDFTILQCGDQLVMIDCPNVPTRIVTYCQSHGLTKFTAFIGSHYHGDHMNGLENLVGRSELDFSDCTFYLPATPDYSQCIDRGADQTGGMTMTGMKNRENEIKAWLAERSYTVVIPENNTTTVFNDSLSIRWLNNDPQEWAANGYYAATVDPARPGVDTGNTIINNFSLCCDICHGDKHLLWTGDISTEAQAAIVPYLKDISLDVLKVQHHNVNVNDNEDYVAAVNPSIMIVEGTGVCVHYPTVAKGLATGAKVYFENWCKRDMLFYSDGYSVTAVGDTEAGQQFGDAIKSGTDLNDLMNQGVYYRLTVDVEVTHAPSEVTSGFRLECKRVTGASYPRLLQVMYLNATPSKFYMRYYGADGWGSWYRYGGETVT